jgi:hypothetical protein
MVTAIEEMKGKYDALSHKYDVLLRKSKEAVNQLTLSRKATEYDKFKV